LSSDDGQILTETSMSSIFIILGVQLCFRRFPIDGFSGGLSGRNK